MYLRGSRLRRSQLDRLIEVDKKAIQQEAEHAKMEKKRLQKLKHDKEEQLRKDEEENEKIRRHREAIEKVAAASVAAAAAKKEEQDEDDDENCQKDETKDEQSGESIKEKDVEIRIQKKKESVSTIS